MLATHPTRRPLVDPTEVAPPIARIPVQGGEHRANLRTPVAEWRRAPSTLGPPRARGVRQVQRIVLHLSFLYVRARVKCRPRGEGFTAEHGRKTRNYGGNQNGSEQEGEVWQKPHDLLFQKRKSYRTKA